MRTTAQLWATGRTPANSADLTAPRGASVPQRPSAAGPAARRGPRPSGFRLGQAACIVGLLFAAVSIYWGLGGTWLLATVRASLAEPGGASIGTLLVAAWAPAILKLIAAVLPLLAVRQLTSPVWNRRVRLLAWLEAGIMTTYGLTLTVVGLLVQADIIHASASADHRALAWHAYLWDPWFLIWGLLVAAALWRGRHRRSQHLALSPS